MDEHTRIPWTPDGDLPPRLAAVLAAARRPGDARELAGEAVARAAFRDHYRTRLQRRRPAVLSKRFPVKAAIAAVGALSVVGVAAAAADDLPGRLGAAGHGAAVGPVAAGAADPAAADRTARLALCEAARGPVTAERGPAAAEAARLAGGADRVGTYCAEVAGGSSARDAEAGPAGSTGLCRAWTAGRGTEQGGRELAAAFAALARVAGGADRIAAYCATTTAGSTAARPGGAPDPAPSRHAPAATPSHPVPPAATERPGGPGSRPAPAPTAPPGRGRTP